MSSPTLTGASVQRRESDVVLKWTVVGDMPASGTWLLSTTVIGGENGPIHQFGVKALDGRIIAAFIFDHGAAFQHNCQVNPSRTGDVWTAVFPTRDVDLTESGHWKANLNLDGGDTDIIDGTL